MCVWVIQIDGRARACERYILYNITHARARICDAQTHEIKVFAQASLKCFCTDACVFASSGVMKGQGTVRTAVQDKKYLLKKTTRGGGVWVVKN